MHIKLRLWVKILIFSIILIGSITLYSRYIGIKGIKVKEYSIIDSNIPSNFYGFKIVQISDIHYKVTTDYNDLNTIVKNINELKPDIVILSGDIFDNNIKYTDKDYEDLTKLLSSIDYNIGKYAIKGDSDINNSNYDTIISNSNFIDINDKLEYIYYKGIDPIGLIGISSNYKNNHIKDTISNINTDNTKYNILILHEPDFIDEIDISKYNLILSGHSLGGQVYIPFYGRLINQKYSTKYNKEYYKIDNTNIYISSGIGTNKYKFRFLNKPSINFYRLRNK